MSFPTPFQRYEFEVRREWIDGNGHMNMGYYTVMFDLATDELWAALGVGFDYKRERGFGTFAVESHIIYDNEMLLGEGGVVHSRVLGCDGKRLHTAHEAFRVRDGKRAAAQEFVFLHVDFTVRRVVPWPEEVLAVLRGAVLAHSALPALGWVGRRVAMPG